MERTTAWQALMRAPWRFLASWWPWRALAYLLLSSLMGVLLAAVVFFSLLLLPLWGLVIGAIERRRTRVLSFALQPSAHVRVSRDQRHNWLGIRITEAATWRETVALLADLVIGVMVAAVLFFEGMGVIVVVASGIIGRRRATEFDVFSDVRIGFGPQNWWLAIPVVLLALAVAAYVNVILAGGQATLLRALLTPRQAELARNVERLTRSRATLVAAFEAERRRIERDLHDGVQQELVTLAARLGLVSLELDEFEAHGTDAAGLRAALEATQDQAEHTMATLRSTVRGIPPAVLTDRGLAAALGELAERTPVPLVLSLDGLERMPEPLETAAYYLVTEAITNAAKHTAATRVRVDAHSTPSGLVVAVTDNGHGGADESGGTGLRGLRERAEALGGGLDIESPSGGPTMLRMTLPVIAEGAGTRADTAR